MKQITRKHFIGSFSPSHPSMETVSLRESFWVETHDCYGGKIRTEQDLRPQINISPLNPSTGPIAVKGVRKGDIIRVSIEEIQLDDQGVMVMMPGLGPLGNMVQETNTKIIPIHDGAVYFSDNIHFPVQPMIGVLGVAPETGEISTATPGNHGGNMDTKEITTGSHVYFPVFIDGANLALGDLHAAMGDGEMNGTGVEIAGKVRLSVSKVPDFDLSMPLVETKQEFLIVSSQKTYDKAIQEGMKQAASLLQYRLDLSFTEAYRLLSATGDLRISQIVNPCVTVKIAIPKSLLPKQTLFNDSSH